MGEETVLMLVLSGVPELAALWTQLQAEKVDAGLEAPCRRRFDEMDGHRWVARAKQILRGLAFRESDWSRPARTMARRAPASRSEAG